MPSRRRVLSTLGAASVAASAGCLSVTGADIRASPGTKTDTEWPQPRFDARNTAYNPVAKAPRERVRERWTFSGGGSASGVPAVADGHVFLPTVDGLIALDAASGKEQWRFAPGQQPWATSPVIHDGMVYLTQADEDSIHALDAQTGTEQWLRSTLGGIRNRPHLIAGEHIAAPSLVVGTENGHLAQLDLETGETTWEVDLFGTIRTIASDERRLFVGTYGGELYAYHGLEPDTPPQEAWRRKVGSAVSSILPDEEGILVQTFGGPLQCLQDGAHAGTTRWTVDGKWANTAPVSAHYTFLAAGYEATTAFREHDANQQWRLDGRYDATDPVAAGDRLYVSSGTAVHAIALDGGIGISGFRPTAMRWSHSTPASAVEGLAVGAGALFVACEGNNKADTTLYCLEEA